jgi:hypothetical protein
MKKNKKKAIQMRRTPILTVLAALGLYLGFASPARATFTMDPTPGGNRLILSKTDNAPSFVGDVMGNAVTVTTIGNADAANGWATIKPVKNGDLTSLTFTPANPNLFGSFSFRGQLLDSAGGAVEVRVQDNQGGPLETINFTGLGAQSDFSRVGIMSPDGKTIKSVTLVSNFKEQKLDAFGIVPPPTTVVPEPATLLTGAMLLLPFGVSTLRVLRNRKQVA